MKRREIRERDDAVARDQAEQRTEALLARLKAQEAAARLPDDDEAAAVPPEQDLPEPDATAEAERDPA